MNADLRRKELARIVEQTLSAIVDDDEFVYFVALMPREVPDGAMAWTHVSSAPFVEIGPVLESAIHEQLRQFKEKSNG